MQTQNGRAFSAQYRTLMDRSMQNGTFDSGVYRSLTRELAKNLLRSIENYTDNSQTQQILFNKVDEKFPLDVNNIPVANFAAPAA